MKICALDIPDEPAQLADWLESHVAGSHLGELVAELAAVHGSSRGASVQEVLGPSLETVLAGGLGAVPMDRLRRLLRQPGALLELQELILLRGGPYWDARVGTGAEESALRAHGRKRLETLLGQDTVTMPATIPFAPQQSWYQRPLGVSLATAAAVLLGVFVYRQVNPPRAIVVQETKIVPAPAIAWGWAKPGALPEDLPAGKYLSQLADAAAQWSAERPETSAALAKRLGEFRQGCTSLFLAKHRPLAPQDKQWLLDKCRLWSGKLDNFLESLEDGEDAMALRGQADNLVAKMVETLRAKAREVG